MPSIDGLSPEFQTIGTLIFLAFVALLTAWSTVFGKNQPCQQTKEFSLAGQLADMGPVKELVEGVGLLVQQQVKTNLHLDALVTLAAASIEEQKKERADRDLDEEVQRRVANEVADALERRELADKRKVRGA